MIYRFYQDLATAHITDLEREAQEARLIRRRGVHVKSKLSNLSGLASRLVTQLRRLHGSKRLGLRALADQCEIDQAADFSKPAREALGGASRIAGFPGPRSTRDDSALCLEESNFHDTGIFDSEMSLHEDEFASTKPGNKGEHRAVQCVAQYRCQVR
jgi:hypothetical protein